MFSSQFSNNSYNWYNKYFTVYLKMISFLCKNPNHYIAVQSYKIFLLDISFWLQVTHLNGSSFWQLIQNLSSNLLCICWKCLLIFSTLFPSKAFCFVLFTIYCEIYGIPSSNLFLFCSGHSTSFCISSQFFFSCLPSLEIEKISIL